LFKPLDRRNGSGIAILVLLILVLFFVPVHALADNSSTPNRTTWSRTYHHGLEDVQPYWTEQTSDRGFIVTGLSPFSGAFVWKLDKGGNVEWGHSYIPKGYINSDGFSVEQTRDQGYVIAGEALSLPGKHDFGTLFDGWVMKLDHKGNVEWSLTLGGSENDWFRMVKQTSDRGYLAVGTTGCCSLGSDAWLVKLDSGGEVMWQKTYRSAGFVDANSFQQTSDNGFIVVGDAPVLGYIVAGWIFKTDSSGDILWQKAYSVTNDNHFWSVQQTGDDGGYIVAGDVLHSKFPGSRGYDALFLKLDWKGNQVWEKLYVGGGYSLSPFSIRSTRDGGYIAAGLSLQSDLGIPLPYLLKLDGTGSMVWQRNYGARIFPYGDVFRAALPTRDGGLIVTGSNYDRPGGAWILKLDNNGGVSSDCPDGVVANSTLLDVPVAQTNTIITGLNNSNLIITMTSVMMTGSDPVGQTQCLTGEAPGGQSRRNIGPDGPRSGI